MTWYLDVSSPAMQFPYGGVGWRPVMGDWTASAAPGPGVIDPSGVWHLSGLTPFSYGLGSWVPLVGHWLPADPSGSPLPAAVRALPPVVNEPRAPLGDTLAALVGAGLVDTPATPPPPVAAAPASFPSSSLVGADVSAAAGWQGILPRAGDRRTRTAALDAVFATGLD
jgi:hypothetical protein